MPIAIIELILKIVLEAIQGQPPEVKAKLWMMYLEDVEKWRNFWAKFDLKNRLEGEK
jgi:hypothetical protein